MRISKSGLQFLSFLLTILILVYTMPLSAADRTSRATSIGQVSVVGDVDLRGVRISGDGTLFSGDRMNVGSGAYATVALGSGPKIEVGSGSDVTVTREADSVQVQMVSGNVAFKGDGKAPIHVRVGAYEVTVPGEASGNVAYVGKGAFGVRVLTGSVIVRNTLTKQSFSVQKGSERLVSLQTGDVTQPLARLASAVPSAVPALPQAQSTKLSKSGWIAVIGTAAGVTAAIVVLTTRNDDTHDDANSRLAQVKAISNLNAMAATANSINAAATSVINTATAALTAINNSTVANKAALQASANAVIAQGNAVAAQIATINKQIAALQAQLLGQTGGPTVDQQKQMNQLAIDLNSARVAANDAITALNNLLSQAAAAGVPNLPTNPNLQPIQPPILASASIPV